MSKQKHFKVIKVNFVIHFFPSPFYLNTVQALDYDIYIFVEKTAEDKVNWFFYLLRCLVWPLGQRTSAGNAEIMKRKYAAYNCLNGVITKNIF